MSHHDHVDQTLRALAHAMPQIKFVLTRRERWASFCKELAAILDALETRGDGAAMDTARVRLERLLDLYGVRPWLGGHGGIYRGGSPAFESFPARGGALERSLVSTLRSLLGVEAVPPIESYPEIRTPQEVILGATFPVEVVARAQPASADATPLVLDRARRGPVDLEVELRLPEALVGASAVIAVLRVPETGDSAVIRFAVTARDLGQHEIEVTLRRGAVELLVLRAAVLVRSAEQDRELPTVDALAVRAAPAQDPAAPPPGLVLHLQRSADAGERSFFRVDLRGDGGLVPAPVSDLVELASAAPRILIDLCRDMHGHLPLAEPAARERRLLRLGVTLGERLLPASIRRAFAERRFPEGTSLHIESDDAWVPWEVVAIDDDDGGFFLGERFALTRWLRQGTLRAELTGGHAVLVAPRSAGLVVAPEREALQNVAGAPPRTLEQLAEVQACVSPPEAALGFLHFACHGTADPDAPLAAKLALEDDPLQPLDVPRLRDGATAGPLVASCVFINACQGDIPARQLTGHGGWAEAFLAAGAAVVVAPAWSIRDGAASGFASQFYRALAEGLTAGASARRARLAVRREGDPDRLAHAVYAAPWTRLRPAGR